MDYIQKLNLPTLSPQALRTAEKVLAGFGLISAIPLTVRVLYFGWLYFLRPSSIGKYLQPGAWALVTGASDGIGRGFALDLARRGFNVVLHGRNAAKLEKVAAAIKAAYPARKVQFVIADASASAADTEAALAGVVKSLEEHLDGAPLTVLINNVGGTQPQPPYAEFRDLEPAQIDSMINLNVRFHVQITRALLPLLEGDGNKKALIMHTGSLAGTCPSPFLTVYSPAKQFGATWIGALAREMQETNKNIECLGILPAKTNDTATFAAQPKFFEPNSGVFARSSLDKVGCGHLNVIGYWTHAIQGIAFTLFPEWLQGITIKDAIAQNMGEMGVVRKPKKA